MIGQEGYPDIIGMGPCYIAAGGTVCVFILMGVEWLRRRLRMRRLRNNPRDLL